MQRPLLLSTPGGSEVFGEAVRQNHIFFLQIRETGPIYDCKRLMLNELFVLHASGTELEQGWNALEHVFAKITVKN